MGPVTITTTDLSRKPLSLEQYATALVNQTLKLFRDLKVEEIVSVDLSGHPGKKIVIRSSRGKTGAIIVINAFVYETKAYCITYMGTDERYVKDAPLVTDMIKSLKVYMSDNVSPTEEAQNFAAEPMPQPKGVATEGVHEEVSEQKQTPVTGLSPASTPTLAPVETPRSVSESGTAVEPAVTAANAICAALAADPYNVAILTHLRQSVDSLTDVDVQARCLAACALGFKLIGNAKDVADVMVHLKTNAANARYIKAISSENLSESCTACQGHGTISRPCSYCQGSGHCNFCKGSGHIQLQLASNKGSSTFCPGCRGSGACLACGGKGQINDVRCSACGGQGKKVTNERIRAVYLELLRDI